MSRPGPILSTPLPDPGVVGCGVRITRPWSVAGCSCPSVVCRRPPEYGTSGAPGNDRLPVAGVPLEGVGPSRVWAWRNHHPRPPAPTPRPRDRRAPMPDSGTWACPPTGRRDGAHHPADVRPPHGGARRGSPDGPASGLERLVGAGRDAAIPGVAVRTPSRSSGVSVPLPSRWRSNTSPGTVMSTCYAASPRGGSPRRPTRRCGPVPAARLSAGNTRRRPVP